MRSLIAPLDALRLILVRKLSIEAGLLLIVRMYVNFIGKMLGLKDYHTKLKIK